ncbi:DgyrCDS13985 [Dimorphilus gyrociliatus]|uniref:DgyrCDS13985 n=1 Tax=Dimorphilus gyrociliatus TaxID=2664684 RepID=A0A7I8WC74_9ANNE|nr:DgyrCDS13985 [Dimorphilus gyrociliatus]
MVMHAAKYPRLEVGYTGHVEKPRAHRCDNNDRYGSEKSHNRLEASYKGELEKSPRYPSKSRDTRSHKGERNRTNHVHSRNSEKTRSDKESQFRSRDEPEPEKRRDDQRRKIKDDSRRVAIRYCGDWTEQRSSTSNRIYYFNTATEESRWEKPPEWEDSRAKVPDHSTSSSMPHRRHNSQSSNRPYERPSSSASANHQKSWHESSRDTRHSSTRPADYHRTSNGPRRPIDDRHTSSSRRDSSSKDARQNNERSGSITSSGNRKDRREEASRTQVTEVKDLGEDMEISPTSSPCSSTHSSPSIKGKQNSKAMVEVLKNIQEALTKKSIIGKKICPTDGGSNGRIPTANNDEDPDDDYESPEDGSDQDSRTSSVPPETPEDMNIVDKLNSQLPPSTGSLSKLKPRSRDTVPTLPPSLADYYDESLIGHVKSWPSELAETETWKLGGELLQLKASNSQVSVDLKRYRSAVRLANVQATLKEQRIIFLQKLQKNIEESKPARHFQDDCVS